ncbi:ROK family protein [Cellulomonas marina]|uniref:Sugar kinase of the NBD/HSP70 family, may contain an N-terminal HTH domain n=1 Tax=Cellulomonas marina TaxID=988821 RepID=A0A1I0Z2G0_9CELL|nr:ROK family protein [Cellulomonas marina]GIG28200.1 NagC family transcriptional regulator [Cellulomonas marina]SFB19805.1 Sugar kinase of the NBD/HSP70 family, may contain an N-terminal HTH domain [Cellulomonas marina]
MSTWTAGLDVGGSKVLGVLLEDGLLRRTVRLPSVPGVDGVVGTAEDAVRQLCREQGVEVTALRGVGVGLPGMVDVVTGEVSHAVNLGLAGAVPVARPLTDRLGVPVALENDLNAAALGAATVLGLHGDLAFLSLGTGVAAGLLLDGRLRRGHSGAAGEIGHLPYDLDGDVCPCGQRGCLELYASGAAIAGAWRGPAGVPPAAALFDAAAAGDVDAVAVRTVFTDAVATAVQVLVQTCDVEHVVIGGGVAQLGFPLLVAVRRSLAARTAGSPFLASLALADRVQVARPELLVAPIGAALAAAVPPDRAPEEAVVEVGR